MSAMITTQNRNTATEKEEEIVFSVHRTPNKEENMFEKYVGSPTFDDSRDQKTQH